MGTHLKVASGSAPAGDPAGDIVTQNEPRSSSATEAEPKSAALSTPRVVSAPASTPVEPRLAEY